MDTVMYWYITTQATDISRVKTGNSDLLITVFRYGLSSRRDAGKLKYSDFDCTGVQSK